MRSFFLKQTADLNRHNASLFISAEQYLQDFNIYNPFCLSFEGLKIEHLRVLVGHIMEQIPNMDQREKIQDAFILAEEIHSRQIRDNQDPYLMHSLKVAILAYILNDRFHLHQPIDFLMEAALLHDTREDHSEFWAWYEFRLLNPKGLPETIDALLIDHETIGLEKINKIIDNKKIESRYFQPVNPHKFILPRRLIDENSENPNLEKYLFSRRVFKKHIPAIDDDKNLSFEQKTALKKLRDEFLEKRQMVRDMSYKRLERKYPRTLKMRASRQISVARMIFLLSKPHVLGLTEMEAKAAIEKYYLEELGTAPLIVKLIKLADRFSNLYDLKHVENAPGRFLKLIGETKKYLVPMIQRVFSKEVNLWMRHMLEPNQMNHQAAIGSLKARSRHPF